MEWPSEHTLTYLTLFIGLLLTIYSVSGRLFPWLVGKYMDITGITAHTVKITQLVETIEELRREFVSNGGSSLKDSITRIELVQTIIESKQEHVFAFIRTHANTNTKALFETDENGACIWINRAHARLTRFSIHEIMGDGWVNVIAPETRESTYASWHKAVLQKREFDEILTYVNPTTSERYKVHVIAYPVLVYGALKGYLGEVTYYPEDLSNGYEKED